MGWLSLKGTRQKHLLTLLLLCNVGKNHSSTTPPLRHMIAVQPALRQALRRLLKPLVRLLLRHGVAFAAFSEVCKQVYVETANQEFSVPGRKQSLSRVAVITGIHRREVKRLLSEEPAEVPHRKRHNRAARVISAWMHDGAYSEQGVPQVLSVNQEFSQLVNQYGGDVPPRAVLDELVRVGAVRRVEYDKVALVMPTYTPTSSPEDALHIFGDSVSDLIATLDHNLQASVEDSRLQLSVIHTNVPDECLQELSSLSKEKAIELLQKLDGEFATRDREHNALLSGQGRNRVGIGVYYFEQPYKDEES